jgi:hypothetical protein
MRLISPSDQNLLSFENIRQKVVSKIKQPIKSMDDLEGYLVRWWCRRYNQPYKCSEVLNYTLEELVYEYLDVLYRDNPDKIDGDEVDEAQIAKEDEEWFAKHSAVALPPESEGSLDEMIDVHHKFD